MCLTRNIKALFGGVTHIHQIGAGVSLERRYTLFLAYTFPSR